MFTFLVQLCQYGQIEPQTAELSDIFVHPFVVVCRYRDPQLQMGEN